MLLLCLYYKSINLQQTLNQFEKCLAWQTEHITLSSFLQHITPVRPQLFLFSFLQTNHT